MKRLILFLTASLIFIVVDGQTNSYHPFPDSNAVWSWQACAGPPPTCGSLAYFLNGDTIVNSINYHKLYENNIATLVGGIRNDTNSKKTYFICLNSNINPNCINHITEKILYDFNAGINDTVFYGTCEDLIVMSIDSIQLLDGTFRKRFRCDYKDVIEGIGNTANLICGGHDGMVELDLLCFQKNGTPLFTSSPNLLYNPNPNPCLPVGMQEQNETLDLTISPNPFCAQTVLQTVVHLYNATLTVDNCFGQTVAQIKNISGQTIVFNRDNLSSGLYFIRLTEQNTTIAVDKLVISDK